MASLDDQPTVRFLFSPGPIRALLVAAEFVGNLGRPTTFEVVPTLKSRNKMAEVGLLGFSFDTTAKRAPSQKDAPIRGCVFVGNRLLGGLDMPGISKHAHFA